jgi:hypothetical protein
MVWWVRVFGSILPISKLSTPKTVHSEYPGTAWPVLRALDTFSFSVFSVFSNPTNHRNVDKYCFKIVSCQREQNIECCDENDDDDAEQEEEEEEGKEESRKSVLEN